MSDRYAVKEVFATIQGEGRFAGMPAVFVRFAGCNLWSGLDEHRERDAERNQSKCPRFCDTDFVGGKPATAVDVVDAIGEAWRAKGLFSAIPLVVFTGGEPALQLDVELLSEVRSKYRAMLSIETNGTKRLDSGVFRLLDNVCVSPKVVESEIVQLRGNELKVVFPAYDPSEYERLAGGFDHRFVSPEAATTSRGCSALDIDVMDRAAKFCMSHPAWKLSIQQHKVLGWP